MLAIHRALRDSTPPSASAFERLKDHDDLAWLEELDDGPRAEWLRRRQWLQKVDRLAVEEPLATDAESFANHYILPCDPLDMGVTWREAWRGYISAAHRYHQPGPRILSLAEHHEMLLELGGHQFCLLPCVDFSLRRAIAHFGALDRFFTNLRDLSQDPARGVYHFPIKVLKRFGVRPRDLASRTKRNQPEYQALMKFWLDDYLSVLRLEAAEFSHMPALSDPLRSMRRACLRRHARIEAAYRECWLDFERAGAAYWLEVDRHRQRQSGFMTKVEGLDESGIRDSAGAPVGYQSQDKLG